MFVWFWFLSHFVCWNKTTMEEIQTLNCVSLAVSMALTTQTHVASSGASVATNPLGAVD